MNARSRYKRTIYWDNPQGPGAGWTIEEEIEGEVYETRYEGRGLMTVADAAEALDVNRKTVYRWIEDGEIRAVMKGGALRIPNSEVKQLLLEEE